MVPRPHWFSRDTVMVSTAPTCGISKSGGTLYAFDPSSGRRVEAVDQETGEPVPVVDDVLLADIQALRTGGLETATLRFIPRKEMSLSLAVPTYYDRRYHEAFIETMTRPEFSGSSRVTLGQLLHDRVIDIRHGHGSAPKDLRTGDVPYIKVSDLRAGMVNINPTNRVPKKWAERMWRGTSSGLQPFDLLCPERASRNIGDFCVLMPGQEQLLLTKEIIVLRPGPAAFFDSFYLLWALTLRVVRDQWHRVVFMQTNREDVGKRYYEVEIPLAPDAATAARVSQPFRDYFLTIASAREQLQGYLENGNHHFFVSGAELPAEETISELKAAEEAVSAQVPASDDTEEPDSV
jgi:type I restriction enzyme M protein